MFTGFTITNSLLFCVFVVGHSFLTRHIAYAGSCSLTSVCTCRDNDGREVDLSPLVQELPVDKPWFPYVKGPNTNYSYAFNPCRPFSDGTCANVTICQTDNTKSSYQVIAVQNEGRFYGDVNSLQIHYSHSDSGCNDRIRNSTVILQCDSGLKGPGTFTVTSDDRPQCSYEFELRSRYACSKGGGSQSSRLSIGSIILIVFFVSLALYFLIGFLVQRFVRNAQGVEMIPNLEFWSSLPALTKALTTTKELDLIGSKDGCLFSFHALKKCSGRSDGYQKI